MVTRSLKQKFWNKRVNAKKEGIDFCLTLDKFLALMREAGIQESDLHIKGYHLSRYFDNGAYKEGNCRFVPYLDNYAEKKVSAKASAASRRTALAMCEAHKLKNINTSLA